MEEFALVEADFQQYYQLNLDEYIYSQPESSRVGFLRYARLFYNLPPDSRIATKLNPVGSWSWQNELSSRILWQLDKLNASFINANRKKGTKPEKPGKQLQPEYVEKAKEDYVEWLKDQARQQKSREQLKAFWQKRNPNVKFL